MFLFEFKGTIAQAETAHKHYTLLLSEIGQQLQALNDAPTLFSLEVHSTGPAVNLDLLRFVLNSGAAGADFEEQPISEQHRQFCSDFNHSLNELVLLSYRSQLQAIVYTIEYSINEANKAKKDGMNICAYSTDVEKYLIDIKKAAGHE